MKIQVGDKIYFYRSSPASKAVKSEEENRYNYRTVRAVTAHGIKIYFHGVLINIPLSDVRAVKNRGVSHGKNELSRLMFLHGLRNEDVAEKSGYAITTIDRARNDRADRPKVKPRTIADLLDTIKQLAVAA